MRKTFLLSSFAAIMLAGCTKNTTTNNITTPLPAFTVNGIHDLSFVNGNNSVTDFSLSVQYSDSSQEVVSLSLSSLPAGIAIDTTWITSGIPTFGTDLTFYDTTSNGATVGTYPMTLTATGATTGKKTYSFNIKIAAQPPCTGGIVGVYNNSESFCGASGAYRDSVYADPTVVNKIWFTNFDNTGSKIYGMYSCSSEEITIPAQTVGGISYSGSGDGFSSSPGVHSINLDIVIGSSGSCEIEMN